jgi:translation initiation factor 3 subunit K
MSNTNPPALRTNYFPEHTHLTTTIRNLFATSIASVFSTISTQRLQRWLDLEPAQVDQWCQSVGWSVEGNDAKVPHNGENDVKAGVVKESVELSRKCFEIFGVSCNGWGIPGGAPGHGE